jgi:hypothetical protein
MQYNVPCQACGTGSLITLIWQSRIVLDDENHQLDIATTAAAYQAPTLFWFHMLLHHNFLAGSPKLNYLTLPTVLKDEDYERFMSALGEFFTTYKEPLALLAAETAPGIAQTEEEQNMRKERTFT